jgi:uncharacterized protein with ATP-grasp and redox domains
MCASGDLMEKTLTEASQLLQQISKVAAMRRDWETRLAEEPEYNSRKKKCAEFSKEATPEVTKEDPIPEKLEEEHIKSRTTPSVDFAVSNETNKQKHVKRVATKGVRTNGLGSYRLRRGIRQEKTVP